jgi:hypothetical protein
MSARRQSIVEDSACQWDFVGREREPISSIIEHRVFYRSSIGAAGRGEEAHKGVVDNGPRVGRKVDNEQLAINGAGGRFWSPSMGCHCDVATEGPAKVVKFTLSVPGTWTQNKGGHTGERQVSLLRHVPSEGSQLHEAPGRRGARTTRGLEDQRHPRLRPLGIQSQPDPIQEHRRRGEVLMRSFGSRLTCSFTLTPRDFPGTGTDKVHAVDGTSGAKYSSLRNSIFPFFL